MENYFNPDFTIIDKILAAKKAKGKNTYFVKWKGLPYDQATWETEDQLKSGEVLYLVGFCNCCRIKPK